MVERTPLGAFTIAEGRMVERVQAHRLTLPPGGKTGLHNHPCPVVCFVTDGHIIVQVADGPPQTFAAGQTIFEPADTPIRRFDNASDSQPATFIATYLLGERGDELIHMLE